MSRTSHFARALEATLEAALVLSFAAPRLARGTLIQVGRMLVTAYGLAQLAEATVGDVEDTELDVLDIALRRIARGHRNLLAQLAGQTAAWALALSVDPAHARVARANLLAQVIAAGPIAGDPRPELVARLNRVEGSAVGAVVAWSNAAGLALLAARLGHHVAVDDSPPGPTTRPVVETSEEECDA